MHNEIMDFIVRMRMAFGHAFAAEKVLECGSFDINGNPRSFFFMAKEYVGVDWRAGKGVDVVSLIHEYRDKPNGYFNFVISTSLLEHDPHWQDSIARMVDLLAPGGSLLITCGGLGFHQHELETSPRFTRGLKQNDPGNYYYNRSAHEIVDQVAQCGRFRLIQVEDDPTVKDVRLFAMDLMAPFAGVPPHLDSRTGVAA